MLATSIVIYLSGVVLALVMVFALSPACTLFLMRHGHPARRLADLLLGTPLERLAVWVRPAYLDVPDAVAGFVAGCLIGALFPQMWARLVLVFGVAFCCTRHSFLMSLSERAAAAANTGNAGFFVGAIVVMTSPLLGAFLSARLERSREQAGVRWLCAPSPLRLRNVLRNRIWWTRVAAMVVLALVTRPVKWTALQYVTRDAVALVLKGISLPIDCGEHEGDPTVSVGPGAWVRIDGASTYITLLALLAPLVWGASVPAIRNACRICALAAAVFVVNVVRITAATVLYGACVAWEWCGPFPNCLAFTGPIVVAAVARISETPHTPPKGAAGSGERRREKA